MGLHRTTNFRMGWQQKLWQCLLWKSLNFFSALGQIFTGIRRDRRGQIVLRKMRILSFRETSLRLTVKDREGESNKRSSISNLTQALT